MNDDCLKLTTYFGERDCTPEGPVSEKLMAIYGEHGLQASILLRGVEGFGRFNHLHTDRLLSLSEDLPVVSVAIDERRRIEALLEPVMQIKQRGLVTLERARLLSEHVGPVAVPEALGEATKLTVYLGRLERVDRTPTYIALCDLLCRRGVAGATVLLGVDGTRGGDRFRARFFGRNADVPVMVIAVGSGERIAAVLPELAALVPKPLITLERVRVCKRDGELLAEPHELAGTDEHGLAMWQKLMVYTSNSATHDGHPLHLAIIRRLLAADAAGATCLRGIWGFHGDRAPHGDKLFQVRRHVPVCTIVIDTPERIGRSFRIIDELTATQGLVTSEMVPAMAAISPARTLGGLRLANPWF
jgi:PII-like signaling protein